MRLLPVALVMTLGACSGAASSSAARSSAPSSGGLDASTTTTTLTSPPPADISSTTTTQAAPSDDQIHRPFELPGQYFRVDPPPPDVRPHLTAAQALAQFRAGQYADFGKPSRNPGVVVRVRFGVFTGHESVTGPPPGHASEARDVIRQPAWVVILTGFRATCTMCTASAPSYGLTVVSDADGHSYGFLIENGGSDPGIG